MRCREVVHGGAPHSRFIRFERRGDENSKETGADPESTDPVCPSVVDFTTRSPAPFLRPPRTRRAIAGEPPDTIFHYASGLLLGTWHPRARRPIQFYFHRIINTPADALGRAPECDACRTATQLLPGNLTSKFRQCAAVRGNSMYVNTWLVEVKGEWLHNILHVLCFGSIEGMLGLKAVPFC